MMDKYLPIQFVEKRRILDEQKVPGNRDNKPLKWIMSGQELIDHSRNLDADTVKRSTRTKVMVQESHLS